MVWNGAIMENSAQAARLSLYSNCSLGIRNIVAEDAGLYWCWSGNTTAQDTIVGLHILNSEYLDCNAQSLLFLTWIFGFAHPSKTNKPDLASLYKNFHFNNPPHFFPICGKLSSHSPRYCYLPLDCHNDKDMGFCSLQFQFFLLNKM